MSTSTTFIGLDAHKKFIAAAIMFPGAEQPELLEFANNAQALRSFVGKLRQRTRGPLRACYEAGPLGFALQRQLEALGVETTVIAPSKIWTQPGAQVKTDRRDARKLVVQFMTGMLTPVRTPTEAEEAARSLCRAREDAKYDETRAKNRLDKLLTRLDIRWTGKTAWTVAHWEWLDTLRFEDTIAQYTFDSYVTAVRQAMSRVATLTEQIEDLASTAPYAEPVARLRCFRGIDTITAMTLLTELHGFERFTSARQLMSYLGLVPSEHSSGGKQQRGKITKSGNAHVRRVLIESAWHYRHPTTVSAALRKRRAGQSATAIHAADSAMHRLHARWYALHAANKPNQKIAVAIARELVGYVWAVLTNTPVLGKRPRKKKSDEQSSKTYKLKRSPTKAEAPKAEPSMGERKTRETHKEERSPDRVPRERAASAVASKGKNAATHAATASPTTGPLDRGAKAARRRSARS